MGGRGWAGWRGVKGEKWDNCNSIMNILKKKKEVPPSIKEPCGWQGVTMLWDKAPAGREEEGTSLLSPRTLE